ncbi:MAG: GNAT family N-acetyltransferase [Pyrinomonadaceae bacterium]|nr:GNAT family N-acetyltransferase [Pyrinomonadaceae bacterium]
MESKRTTCQEMNIFPAVQADLADVLALLTSVDLPHEGVEEHFSGFLVAKDQDGRLAGTIGIERHGSVALLRSAAVAGQFQHSGLGSCLTNVLLETARKSGIEKVVLLTSTASGFFARRFGFAEAARSDYDGRLADSPEWRLPRCSSAVCMSLDLNATEKTQSSTGTNN